MSSLNAKLSEMDKLELDLAESMQIASKCLSELSKDKVTHRTVENQAQEFIKRIRAVENGILSQINYLNQVGVGASHEGAAYLACRERQAAVERMNFLHDTLAGEQRRLQEREEQASQGAEISATNMADETEQEDVTTNADAEMMLELN